VRKARKKLRIFMLPAFVMLRIACCVAHFNVPILLQLASGLLLFQNIKSLD